MKEFLNGWTQAPDGVKAFLILCAVVAVICIIGAVYCDLTEGKEEYE